MNMQDLESIKKQLQEESLSPSRSSRIYYSYAMYAKAKLEGIELVESLFKKGLLTPKHDDNTHCMCGEETFNPPQCDVCSTKGLDRVVNNHVKLAKQELIREIEKIGSDRSTIGIEIYNKEWQSLKKRHGVE